MLSSMRNSKNIIRLWLLMLPSFYLFSTSHFDEAYSSTYGGQIIQKSEDSYEKSDSIALQVLKVVEEKLDASFFNTSQMKNFPKEIKTDYKKYERKDNEKAALLQSIDQKIIAICEQHVGTLQYDEIKWALSESFHPTDSELRDLTEYKRYQNFFPNEIEKNCSDELLKQMESASQVTQITKGLFHLRKIPGDFTWEDSYGFGFILELELIDTLKKLADQHQNFLLLEILNSVEKKLPHTWAKKINLMQINLSILNSDFSDETEKDLNEIKDLLTKRVKIVAQGSALSEIQSYMNSQSQL